MLQLLGGNKDAHTVKVSYLEHPVTARFLRLHVQAWHNHPSLKMDIIGCQSKYHQVYTECPKNSGMFVQTAITSLKSIRKRRSCEVSYGFS